MKLRPVGLLTIVGLVVASGASAIFLLPFYRWASAPVTQCLTDEDGPYLRFSNQPREWLNLSTTAQVQTHFITNGIDFTSAPFDPPDGTGSQTYSPFGSNTAPYPFTYTMLLDTLDSDDVKFRSALTATCTGDGTATSAVINWLPAAIPIHYRWAYAPAVTCTTIGSEVLLRFAAQPIAWRNLPDTAEFDIVYSENGVENPDGPFPLPSGDGFLAYGPLGASRPAYPLHYAVRLDTKLSDTILHQSVLVGACESDGAGTSRIYDVPEPGAASLALAALATLALRTMREKS